MNELDLIRQRKLEQLQEQVHEQTQINAQILQVEEQIKPRLTKEALARYSNIKIAHPEKFMQMLYVLSQIISTKKSMIDDNILKEILITLDKKRK